jgi:hypothetical protein
MASEPKSSHAKASEPKSSHAKASGPKSSHAKASGPKLCHSKRCQDKPCQAHASEGNRRCAAVMQANENFPELKTPTGLFFLTIRVCAKIAL